MTSPSCIRGKWERHILSLVETQIVASRKRFLPGAQAQIARYFGMGKMLQNVWNWKVTPALSQSLVDDFDRRIVFVAASLEKRKQKELYDPRCDLLLATYVLGLTAPFYEDGPPDRHLDAIRNCLVRVMPHERVTQALLVTPADGNDWYSSALEPIEAIGRKDGRALFIRYVGGDGTTSIQNEHSYQSAPEMNGGFKEEPAVTNLRGTAK